MDDTTGDLWPAPTSRTTTDVAVGTTLVIVDVLLSNGDVDSWFFSTTNYREYVGTDGHLRIEAECCKRVTYAQGAWKRVMQR